MCMRNGNKMTDIQSISKRAQRVRIVGFLRIAHEHECLLPLTSVDWLCSTSSRQLKENVQVSNEHVLASEYIIIKLLCYQQETIFPSWISFFFVCVTTFLLRDKSWKVIRHDVWELHTYSSLHCLIVLSRFCLIQSHAARCCWAEEKENRTGSLPSLQFSNSRCASSATAFFFFFFWEGTSLCFHNHSIPIYHFCCLSSFSFLFLSVFFFFFFAIE